MTDIDYEIALRLLVACLLGGLIGMERENWDRPAGFRTHILVCTGSALVMVVSMYGFAGFPEPKDPARLAAQVVSGIGFLGAGTILHEGLTVKGLTTAASLWMVAAVGLAVGTGMYATAVIATLIMVVTLSMFAKVEKHFFRVAKHQVRVSLLDEPGSMSRILRFFETKGIRAKTLSFSHHAATGVLTLDLFLIMDRRSPLRGVLLELSEQAGVIGVENPALRD